MASRRELLDSLKPGMHLDKNFFLKIYGYDITRPGFADDVIRRLEILGCSKARDYYTCIVSEYNHKHDQEMKRVSEWYAKQDTEDEMFADYPDRANVNVFYGGNDYHLFLRAKHDYIYSSFGYSSLDLVDAFAILTRDGAVLLSDDAKVTFEEDAMLSKIVKNMIWRREEMECNKKQ